jgi:CRP/FNR family transcriptional regulator, cyclic AMP receptor protein
MSVVNYFTKDENLKHYKAGEVIYTVGQHDDSVYGVAEGEVDVFFGAREALLETVGPGGVFGERTFIDTLPHTTTAVARTDCSLSVMDEQRFLWLVHETPTFALVVMRLMVKRSRKLMQMAIDRY